MLNRNRETELEQNFYPRGAIAFFAVMLVSFGMIWLAMYLLLVQRQLWI